jgi:hypothetical protein
MLIKSVTKTTTKTASEIWAKYADVANWNTWDTDTEYSSLNGNFELGAIGKVKPKDSSEATFTITEFVEGKSFMVTCNLPLAQIKFNHIIDQKTDGSVDLTHSVELVGFLAPLWNLIIGNSLVKGLDSIVANLC